LREQPERPERDRIEATIAGGAARLGRLVNDLLGLARVEARPKLERLDLRALVRTAAAEAENGARTSRISIEPSAELTIYGDADGLTRLLRNLLDNALHAAPSNGHVNVSIRRVNSHVTARITDDGPGIPDDDRERIFERFVRLNPKSPGSGLGLAIARRIAREHGGNLTCDPSPAGGSFTLHLPLTRATAALSRAE
jgi:signal transduction histidine kinase